MRKRIYIPVMLMLILVWPFYTQAQEKTPVKKENSWYGNPKPKQTDTRKVIAKGMKLGVWFQSRFVSIQQDNPFLATTGQSFKTDGNINNFYVRRLRLLLAGKFYGSWKYVVHIAAGPVGRYETPNKNLRLLDVLVAYTKFKQATLLLGQEKIFFSRPFSDRLPFWKNAIFPMAERTTLLGLAGAYKDLYPSTAIKAIGGSNNKPALKGIPLKFAYRIDQNPGGRAVGALLKGEIFKGYFDYKVGLYNAWRDGLRSTTGYGAPGYLKLVQINFNPWRNTNTSLLGYQGNYFGRGKHLSIGGTWYTQNNVIEGKGLNGIYDTRHNTTGYTLDLAGNYHHFSFAAEYMDVKNNKIDVLSTTTGFLPTGKYPDMELKTWWVQAAYLLPVKVGPGTPEFAVLYEHYNPDAQHNYNMDEINLTHFTLNYYLHDRFARFTLEYVLNNEKNNPHRSNQFIAQFAMALWK